MEELLRTKVGRFSLEESHTLSEVQAAMEEGTIQDQIYPVEQVLADYPAVYADSYGDRLLLNGNPLSENLVSPQHKEGWVCACMPVTKHLQVFFSGIRGKRNIIR